MIALDEELYEFICERIDSKFESVNSDLEYQENLKKIIELYEEISKHLPLDKQYLLKELDLVSSKNESITQIECFKIGFKDAKIMIQI